MSEATPNPPGPFVRVMRKVYHHIGFTKGYNFALWLVFTGAFLGFTLARLQFLNFHGQFCNLDPDYDGDQAAPGECFYLRQGHYTAGIILHLATVLPSAILVCFQFVPFIRRRFTTFHRVNGYAILLLSLLSAAGVFMVARRSFGGGLDVQGAVGTLSLMFLGALALAWYNIKKVRIEQHRAWMLRAWFYAGSIITNRIIVALGMVIVSASGEYYTVQPCDKISSIVANTTKVLQSYPDCATFLDGTNLDKHIAVLATTRGGNVGFASLLNSIFGMALWLAIAVHAIGIEVYLQLTPAEHERLRQVSLQRRLEGGKPPPGHVDVRVSLDNLSAASNN